MDTGSFISTVDAEHFKLNGFLVLHDFFRGIAEFATYVNDLKRLCMLASTDGSFCDEHSDLGECFPKLYSLNPTAPKTIFDLCATPTKICSALALRSCEPLLNVATNLLGSRLLGMPACSDYLMLMLPMMERSGNSYQEQHQDYPHMLQSPHQITMWIPLSKSREGIGGIDVRPKSHVNGMLPFRHHAKSNHYETVHNSIIDISPLIINWDLYDLVILDSMLVHGSIANLNPKYARVTQLFRYSNLEHPEAVSLGWRSSVPKSGTFQSASALYPSFNLTTNHE
jgi:hypothetical protein